MLQSLSSVWAQPGYRFSRPEGRRELWQGPAGERSVQKLYRSSTEARGSLSALGLRCLRWGSVGFTATGGPALPKWLGDTNPSSPPATGCFTPAQFLCLPEESVLRLRTALLCWAVKWRHRSGLLLTPRCLCVLSRVAKWHTPLLLVSILISEHFCPAVFHKWPYFNYSFW